MFTVYHSNQLDLLKQLIAALIEGQPLQNPFEQEVILVQSPGMAQWLQMELAKQFGIAANIEFPLPATLIWNLFTQVMPGIPKESAKVFYDPGEAAGSTFGKRKTGRCPV